MKAESETEDAMLAKCPLPFSIWMISLSEHDPLKICLFSIPAREISHSTHWFLSLNPYQVIVLPLKGEHTQLSQWIPSPGLFNWTAMWPTLGFQLYNSFDSTYCTWSPSPLCMNRCHLHFTCLLHTIGRLDCQQDCTEPLPHWGNWAQRPAEVMHQSLRHTAGCLVRHWSRL